MSLEELEEQRKRLSESINLSISTDSISVERAKINKLIEKL